jgi:uncharacterized membrane protein
MVREHDHGVVCSICHKMHDVNNSVPVESISLPLLEIISKEYPHWGGSEFVCKEDINHLRTKHIRNLLKADKGELTTLEEQVMQSLKDEELLSKNINTEFDGKLTLGQRFADKLADYAGSWHFIILFMSILMLWIIINSIIIVLWRPFDPYPFILLNLVLSCIAALQAPVIMMSQNRQEAKDRLRSEHDYMVNLKAELEIRHLHDKLDHLIVNQWQRLLEIQQIQVELMEELACKKPDAAAE